MNSNTCEVCLTAKTPLRCELCKKASCKQCSIFIDEDRFELFVLLPQSLQHKTFCPQCYNEDIAEQMTGYEEILQKAKQLDTYDITQSSETRLMKRLEKPVKVSECEDRKEALLHLAFRAAERGFDTIIDVNITPEKSGQNSYMKKIWSGTAVPINLKK